MASEQRKGEVLPNPDPSSITTESIDRAIHNLENRIDARFNGIEKATDAFHADLTRVPTLLDRSVLGLRELIETRLLCMENDVKGVHAYLDTRAKDISDQIVHLRDLSFNKIEKLADVTDERLKGLSTQVLERDVIKDQTARDVKGAVDAAFAAAKEAVSEQNKSNALSISKSEAAFTKQIDGILVIINTMASGINDKIDDIKERIGMIESRANGTEGVVRGAEKTTDRSGIVISQIIAGTVAFVIVASAIVTAIAYVIKH